MAKIDRITEDKIKQAADIVAVIEDWVRLRKSGVEYVGLCPFHEDHTPTNFKVSKTKQMYKCFACGEGGDVFTFLEKKANLKYGDALLYLAEKFSVYVPDEDPKERERFRNIKPAKPRDVTDVEPEKQMLVMPRSWVSKTMKAQEPCVFIDWFRSLPWANDPMNNQRGRVDDMLWQYCVGRWTQGRVVFWYIDEQGRPRGGKIMTYLPTGKRYHEDKSKGEPNSTQWIHYQRGKSGQWLCDMKTYAYRHLLFGSHLLNRYPQATVNIVESEKTALICAVAYGHPERNLWLACGGLDFFKLEHIQPLISAGRRIWMWPDKDGIDKWKAKTSSILSDRVTLTTKFIDDNWVPEDGEKADVADIILRHIQHPETIRQNHTGDPQPPTRVGTGGSAAATPDPSAGERPDGVSDEEWLEHLSIMKAIRDWNLTHVPDEPFPGNTPLQQLLHDRVEESKRKRKEKQKNEQQQQSDRQG